MKLLSVVLACIPIVSSFAPSNRSSVNKIPTVAMTGTKNSESNENSKTHLYNPTERDSHYGQPLNVAQYLIDLHDSKSTFDFCGGMMFQLVLTDKLRDHLGRVAANPKATEEEQQPVIFDATQSRMSDVISQSNFADNRRIFHGREIRKVPNAEGGMGFVLQLSMADAQDPDGWTKQEIEGYDGWRHDVGRTWRKGERLQQEGFTDFQSTFGQDAFALHHRFYLHLDRNNRMWLSAEDGCEGTPAAARAIGNPLSNLLGALR